MIANARDLIVQECEIVKALLLEKNSQYGSSALEPIRVFSRATACAGVRVRIDDKLSRLARGVGDQEDTVLDLIGYLILLRIAERKESA